MVCGAFSGSAQVLFSQTFPDPTKVLPSDYVATDPNETQFSALSAGSGNIIVIADGKLKYSKTNAGSNMAFTRAKSMTTSPKFVMLAMDMAVSKNTVESMAAGSFNIASPTALANNNTSPSATGVHSRITLYLSATEGTFGIVPVGNNATPAADKLFSGTQRLSWFVNKSGAEATYIGPDGKPYAIPNEASDTWVGTSRISNLISYPARSTAQDLKSFKFAITNSMVDLEFDNYVFQELPLTVPEGSVSINNGAYATNNAAVTLALTTKNATQMRFSNDKITWSAYEPVATSKTWTLTAGQGTKTVYMQVKDAEGDETTHTISDEIVFDATAPAAPSTPDLLASTDSGPSDTDNITNYVNPVFAGTAEPSATVKLYAGDLEIGTAVADATTGAWEIRSAVELPNGVHSITAKATDRAGNVGPASSALSLTIKVGPIVTLTSPASGTTNAPFTVTFSFNLGVTDFTLSDIKVTNGTASAFTVVDAATYTALITPTANDLVKVIVPADAAFNPANNNGSVESEEFKILFDNLAPTVALTASGTGYVKAPFTVTFTFSEAVTGFTLEDLVITNGTASAFTMVNSKVFTALVTPTAEGVVTVAVAAGVAQDLAQNNNTAAAAFSRTYDITAPAGYSVAFVDSRIDGKSSLATLLRISAAEIGANYTYSITSSGGGTTVTGTKVATTSSFLSDTLNVSGLKDGTLTVTFSQTDLGGNKGANVTAQVQKVIPNVVSFVEVPLIKAPSRVPFSRLPLPSQVLVTYSTGEVEMTPVTWNSSGYNGYISGKYQVTGTINALYGATNLSNLKPMVIVDLAPEVNMVNAFTPDGDGMNDTWIVLDLQHYSQVEIEVFDKDGVRLFHTTDPLQGWDGRNRHGKVVKGSYFYVVQVKTSGLVRKGVVTIIKE
ncbi:hypothetical protein TH63_12015 [Rufibacter radiotolerans]|uniref:Uncharacterized protein n=2 Tax=Rufibacter radiotolerans TaxID=1379910 RepID=A0A0H4VLG8_9BACT|nr:hypothetical protein TH63_12015 [Rufibacter radiotolerans]